MDTTKPGVSSTPPPRRKGLRLLVWIAAVFVVLLVAGYFIATSSGFLKGVILPRVGASLNSDITVGDATIHPFREVILRDLKVQPKGREPLLTAAEVHARYGLFDIIRGNIQVEEITISSPVVHLVQNPDGTSNLDPILEAQKSSTQKPKEAAKPSKPPQINVQKFSLANATVLIEKLYAGGLKDITAVSNVNVNLSNLKNGDTGKLSLTADVSVQNHPPSPGASGDLRAAVKSDYTFALSPDLKPLSVKGESHLDVSRAEGSFSDLAAGAATINCEVTPGEIKQFALRFQKDNAPLGELRASGPLDFEKMEGRVKVELLSLDRRLLNLAGAKSGVDFGSTTISSSNDIQLTKSGSVISAAGRLDANKVQLTRQNQTTPVLEVRADYDVTVNRAESNAVLRTFTLHGTQNGNPLLHAELSSPMNLALNNAANAVGDSSLNLTVANLNLADWKPFLSGISKGNVNLNLKLLSRQAGKQLTVDLASQLKDIGPVGGDKTVSSASIGGNFTASFAPNNDLTLKGGLQASNLVVLDPKQEIPATPLETRLQIDATLHPQAIDLRQLQIGLTPTDRAQNELDAQGRVDFSKTDAIQGNLRLTSHALDLTRYYDLLATTKPAAKTNAAPAPQTTAATPAQPQKEPAPVQLPFKNFALQMDIARLYLHEVEITNFQAPTTLDGGRVSLNPLQLALNGGPIKTKVDLDLGVPGYKYAVNFDADQVPLTPLVNTFVPERKGQLGGTFTAHTKINGAGTTDASLQKNLAGDFDVGATNLNLSIDNIHSPLLKSIVNVIATIPELLHNPVGGVGSVLGGITGAGSGKSAGVTDELTQSPIQVIAARGTAGSGKIDLQSVIRSAAFEANANGNIALAAVLTNSALQLPVGISLSRSLADKVNLLPANTPENVAYARLPDFVTIKGTVGKPKADIDKKAVAAMVFSTLKGVPGSGTKPASLIDSVGALLGGRQTNAAATPGNTNEPPANTNPPPANRPSLNDLLNRIRKPK